MRVRFRVLERLNAPEPVPTHHVVFLLSKSRSGAGRRLSFRTYFRVGAVKPACQVSTGRGTVERIQKGAGAARGQPGRCQGNGKRCTLRASWSVMHLNAIGCYAHPGPFVEARETGHNHAQDGAATARAQHGAKYTPTGLAVLLWFEPAAHHCCTVSQEMSK